MPKRSSTIRNWLFCSTSQPARLDPIGTQEMKDLIHYGWKSEGKTIIMCSHQLADVQDVCDRLAILHQGTQKSWARSIACCVMRDRTQIRFALA